jgi:cytochrome c553
MTRNTKSRRLQVATTEGEIVSANADLMFRPVHELAELVKKGACVSCHGENFSMPTVPSYPKIAGQYSDYLYVALKAYKTEGNPQVGRANAVMGGVVKQFSNAELKELAAYVGSLPGELKTVPQSKFR